MSYSVGILFTKDGGFDNSESHEFYGINKVNLIKDGFLTFYLKQQLEPHEKIIDDWLKYKKLLYLDPQCRIRLLSIGTNSSKTHPRNTRLNYRGQDGTDLRYQIGTHAELSAVLRYGAEDCSDCIFVNIRVDKNGQLLYSHPCAGCSSLMRQIGYKKFYYSTANGFEVLR